MNAYIDYGKLVDVSLRMEKQKGDVRKITKKSSLMKTGVAGQ